MYRLSNLLSPLHYNNLAGLLIMISIGNDTNKSFGNTESENTFEKLENKFWENIDELKKLKKSSKEFKELFKENEAILDRVHQFNQG